MVVNMRNKKYLTVGTVSISNWKIVENDKIDTPNTQIHDHSLSCIGISIKCAGVKLVV
jgi:hypothetical protein